MIGNLLHHPNFNERQVLLDNYAESFLQMASHPYKQSRFNIVLKDTARRFRNLLALGDEEEQNEGLREVETTWNQIE